MKKENILETNKTYWNTNADLWFGATSLPTYGVKFPTEDDLHLFGDVTGKKMLDICCGSGHSLKYHADRGAAELWGVDMSKRQLDNAERYLKENGYKAKLICSPMEADMDIPKNYFDIVYSIYGIGWTTDLVGTFKKIASYFKENDNVLDFGSGSGAGSKHLAKILDKLNGHLTCIDISEYWMGKAEKRMKKYNNVDYLVGQIQDLKLKEKSFDIIYIFYSLHDVDCNLRNGIVHEFYRILKDEGRLYIKEPQRENDGMPVDEIKELMKNNNFNEEVYREYKGTYTAIYKK